MVDRQARLHGHREGTESFRTPPVKADSGLVKRMAGTALTGFERLNSGLLQETYFPLDTRVWYMIVRESFNGTTDVSGSLRTGIAGRFRLASGG